LKNNVEKRLSAIERRLDPEPEGGPWIVFIRPVGCGGMTRETFDAYIKTLSAGTAAFILPRPGDSFDKTAAEKDAEAKLKADAGRAFVIEVVKVKATGTEPEPSDAELEAEIARLEAELAAAKVKP
jgi:hypothetical protein